MMKPRLPGIIFTFIGVIPLTVAANLPVSGRLDIPIVTNETLVVCDSGDWTDVKNEAPIPRECNLSEPPTAAIHWTSGWGTPGFVVITWTPEGSSFLQSCSYPADGPPIWTMMGFERDLGKRLIALLQVEMSRAKPPEKGRSIPIDSTRYLFWMAGNPAIVAETGSLSSETTVGRLCRLAVALAEFPHLKEGDRTYALGVIDRDVTAIELAHRFHK